MAGRVPIGKIMDVIAGGRDSAEKVGQAVLMDVRVDSLSPRWAVLAVKEDLEPRQPGAQVDVRRLGAHRLGGEPAAVAVVLAGGSERLVEGTVREYLGQGVPVAVIAESSLDVPELALPEEQEALYTLIAASERAALDDSLAEWLLSATDEHVTMAANFPFCREKEVDRLVQRCALENAAVGAVDLIHGADLPVMCANQLKLLFDMAAAHGRGLSAERIPEAALVVGLSFAYRAMSRSVRRLVPLPKFVTRAALGYAGTVATSKAVGALLAASEGTLRLPTAGDALSWLRGAVSSVAPARDGEPSAAPEAGSDTAPAALLGEAAPDGGYLTYGEGGVVS